MPELNVLDPQVARVLDHAPDLATAIERGEIETVYQPQFTLPDERLIGAEALARWRHPDLGEIGAGPLFVIAAEQGIMTRLSEHIVDNALSEFANWPEAIRLSVNVLPEEVSATDFASAFLKRVQSAAVNPARLTVEITEEVLLGDLARAAITLDGLREAGIRIALDDFGAGFCNFRYLKILPLDYLKLDRSMIDGIAADARDLAVLRGIVAMARALSLRVIAEGIETERQLAMVMQEGCDTFQGFLRAEPMSAERFRAFLRDHAGFCDLR